MNKRTHMLLCGVASSTLIALPAFILPAVANAQTVCAPAVGGIVDCVNGVDPAATGDVNAGTVVAPGPGFVATSAGDLIANLDGTVATDAAGAPALSLTSLGDLTLDMVGTASTTGVGSNAILLDSLGNIDATVGIATTSGAGSDALVATAVGDLGLTAGNITTLSDNSDGLVLTADNIVAVCGTVTTAGDSSNGADATANGSLDFTCDTVATSGVSSDGVVLAGNDITADLGTVTTDGVGSDAVVANAAGNLDIATGSIVTLQDDSGGLVLTAENVVAVCGSVSTAGQNSVGADATASGSVDFTCASVSTTGDNSDAVQITGGDGPVAVTVGPVTTAGIDSDGIDVVTNTGDQTIVAGPVTVTGAGSDGISAVAVGCADIDITATSPIVSADGTAILASSLCAVTVTTLPGASVTGADAGIDVTSGTGATITLNDSVQATDGPAINVDGAATVINVNAGGSIIGRIDLTDADDVLNNGGTFDVIGTSDFGLGNDVINNLAGGTISSTNGNGALIGCETVNNAGTITMIDGAANDTLTICGDYFGTGAANLGIDVDGGTGGLTADQLIILGNAGGSTAVNLNLLAGSAVIDPDGVLIVDAITASGTPFTLNGPTSAGLINYSLLQSGADTFLVSTPDEVIFDFATMGQFAGELWHQSTDAYLARGCTAQRLRPGRPVAAEHLRSGLLQRGPGRGQQHHKNCVQHSADLQRPAQDQVVRCPARPRLSPQ